MAPNSSRGDQNIIHTVSAGETLSAILEAYGIKHLYGRGGAVTRVAEKNWRAITSADAIRPGQKISIEKFLREVASDEPLDRVSSLQLRDISVETQPISKFQDGAGSNLQNESKSTDSSSQRNRESAPLFNPFSTVNVIVGSSYSAFEGLQFSNGTRAKLLSALAPSISLKWKQNWTETVFTNVSFDLRSVTLQPEKARLAINGGRVNESSFRGEVGKSLTKNFGLSFEAGIQNAIFYRGSSSGGLELFQTPIFVLRPSSKLTFIRLDPFDVHVIGALSYFGSSTYDNSPIRSGLGFDGAIGLQQTFKNSAFGCDFKYSNKQQSTEFLELTQKEVGLLCGLSWRL